MTTVVDCPICGKKVEWIARNTYRPFCSKRCKQIDLGAWASGKYAIGGAQEEPPTDAPHGDLN